MSAYASDDYAGITTTNLDFYYGYERYICDECGFKEGVCPCEDSEQTWCFTVNKQGREVFRATSKEIGHNDGRWEPPVDVLIKGIARVIESGDLQWVG